MSQGSRQKFVWTFRRSSRTRSAPAVMPGLWVGLWASNIEEYSDVKPYLRSEIIGLRMTQSDSIMAFLMTKRLKCDLWVPDPEGTFESFASILGTSWPRIWQLPLTLHVLSPSNFATPAMEDPFTTPHCTKHRSCSCSSKAILQVVCCAGTTPNCGPKGNTLDVASLRSMAPGFALVMLLSHDLGRKCNSGSRSENASESRVVARLLKRGSPRKVRARTCGEVSGFFCARMSGHC